MLNTTKRSAVLGVVLSLGLASASGAFAKAHDQGSTDDPGENVGTQTVGPAQTLGGALGQGQGPADTPAGANPGKSEDAGQNK